jgi:proteasome lid subunit RPN8/RPN11
MKWTEERPDAEPAPLADFLRGLPALHALTVLGRVHAAPCIMLEPSCRDGILGHLRSASTELGGLLLGRAYVGGDVPAAWAPAVHVVMFVPSVSFETSRVALRMDTEIWDRARAACAREGHLVVGWYHSHPNLGVFFSSTDRYTQRAFFNRAYSVGLVVDPVRNEEAWFIGAEAAAVAPRGVIAALLPAAAQTEPLRGATSCRETASRLQQCLDRAPLVHRAVALGDSIERQHQIEHFPRIDAASEHEID